jgi:hypothetical protein
MEPKSENGMGDLMCIRNTCGVPQFGTSGGEGNEVETAIGNSVGPLVGTSEVRHVGK